MEFKGIYVPIITPYKNDNTVNEESLNEIIEFLIMSRVNGIIIAGTTGEYYAQTTEERKNLLRISKEIINNRLPLIVGVGAIRTDESIDLAVHAKSISTDALLVNSPPYALPTESENAAHALAIDQAVNLPIMLYNYPGRTGVNMGVEYLKQISKSKNICAIKESSGEINRLHMLATDFPNIQISCGADDQALEFFAWGAQSWVCAGANFAPETHSLLYETCVENNDFTKGRKIMAAMLPLMSLLEKGGKFGQSIKYATSLKGFSTGQPRKPLLSLSETEEQEIAAVIKKMDEDIAAL